MASQPIATGLLLLSEYTAKIVETDVLDKGDIKSVVYGLFGEVGGIMSTAKKHVREQSAYPGFKRATVEEFGDALWYLAALCRRMSIDLDSLIGDIVDKGQYSFVTAASDRPNGAVARLAVPITPAELDSALLRLGSAAADLLELPPSVGAVQVFAARYLDALHATQIVFSEVLGSNLRKARGAFIEPRLEDLEDFDSEFPIEEQLPRRFKIRINQRSSGKSYLQWNGVFIGDPLTDNIGDPDGYRFHDVFHFAHAAILHWSPVFRALIKHKRKSKEQYDEAQDCHISFRQQAKLKWNH